MFFHDQNEIFSSISVKSQEYDLREVLDSRFLDHAQERDFIPLQNVRKYPFKITLIKVLTSPTPPKIF